MDKEEKKMVLKRKARPVGVSFDSRDEEPLGALLKLKGKRNSKKIKLLADDGGQKVIGVERVAVQDEEFGGMDCTLASFRKKLRGPKKDGGSALVAGKDLTSKAVEPSCQSLEESAKDSELGANLMFVPQKRSLGINVGESSGDAAILDSVKVRTDVKNKKLKVNVDTKVGGQKYDLDNGFDEDRSGGDALQHEKEVDPKTEEEPPEDSLSAFFQKVQSGMGWKSRTLSKLKQRKATRASHEGLKPNFNADGTCAAALCQGSLKSTLICQDDDQLPDVLNHSPENSTDSKRPSPSPLKSNEICGSHDIIADSSTRAITSSSGSISVARKSPSSIKACSSKVAVFQDGKVNPETDGGLPGFTNKTPNSNNILDSLPLASDVQQKEHSSSDPNGRVIVQDRCFEETNLVPCPSQEADDQAPECKSSPVLASYNLKDEVVFRMKHVDESREAVNESQRVSDVVPEGACQPKCDYPSEDEEINGSSSSFDHQSSCAEDKGSQGDPETKERNQSVFQRVARIAKKHRHVDMAYEGDIDWEILMQSQEFFISHPDGKAREKLNFSSTAVDSEKRKVAAVSAGLKARAVTPIEKIKFKEVLKRKGGLQEYLECRNRILSVWNKDISRILPLADFGVSDGPLEDESPRVSLIRDIFTFLDTGGYINFGVPSEKEKVETCIKHDLKLLAEEKFGEDSELPVANSEDVVPLNLGKGKCSESCTKGENDDTDEKEAGDSELRVANSEKVVPLNLGKETRLETSIKGENDATDEKEARDSELPVANAEDVVPVNLGKETHSETCIKGENDDTNEKEAGDFELPVANSEDVVSHNLGKETRTETCIKVENDDTYEKEAGDSELPVANSEDGVLLNLGKETRSETCIKGENDYIDEKEAEDSELHVANSEDVVPLSLGKENRSETCIKGENDETSEKRAGDSELPVANSDDGVPLNLVKERRSGICIMGENDGTDEKETGKLITADGLSNVEALESSPPNVECLLDDSQVAISFDRISVKEAADSELFRSIPSCPDENVKKVSPEHPNLLPPGKTVSDIPLDSPKGGFSTSSSSLNRSYSHTQCDSGPRKSIIIVGAGPAGLTAARHLQRQGFTVIVLEARGRIGGRVFTDRASLSVPVDLGASIITGVEADVDSERRPDPSSLICAQLGLELTVLNSDCPLYDTVTGLKVPADLDEALEAEYNSLLDDMELLAAEKGERAMKMSLEEGLEYGLKRHRMANSGKDDIKTVPVNSPDISVATKTDFDNGVPDAQGDKTEGLSPLERRVMDWHFAHLEYGCAALLKDVSLPDWNQDDVYGGFGGAHCMIKGGYSAVVESLGEGICIHMDHVVTNISYCMKDSDDELHKKVKVSTSNGKEFLGDAVLVTVPLGCLKAETIKFSPPLPQWKYLSIKRLGFGVLNKVVLEFPEVFWDDTIDYFGATAEDTDQRGWCFMFWNVKKTVGAPVLIALVVGKAAIVGQSISSSDHVDHALLVLRKLFGEGKVPDPVASVVTDWGRDPYSYGAYSYVAVGSSGEDYDIIGRPVENCVFFAGEATCKEHPDTVGGAMLSGLREAVRIVDIVNTGTDYTAEVEAMEAARRHLDIERSEVKDIIRRLDAVEFSGVLYKKSLDGSRISKWGSMLKEMFFTAKTTAGRLHLVKELLCLPVGFLKTFASTKAGLSTLNSWILDSMGKDGTQLLRHCVRLLVLVSNDLVAVRLSGVGKTIREKVCVHTSRDIRAIASQLVSVWVELFRKEKASKGGRKLLRQPNPQDSKSKSSLVSGKPPLRTHHVEGKGSPKVSGSTGSQVPYGASSKQVVESHPHSDVQLSNSHVMEEEGHEIPMSEEEKAAFAAAEAARAAAIAAAKAYASSGAMHNASLQPPKILSFHKFAMREQYAHMDESDGRKNWSAAASGRQDCLSEIDSRNCRVRDWSVDFSAAGINLENSRVSVDNRSQRSHSIEIAGQLNFREHSGESVAVDNSILTKAWVDSAGSMGIKDYSAIERWQCQAAAASSGFSHGAMHITDEEDSNMSSKLHNQKHDAPANESSASQVTLNKESKGNHSRGKDQLKQAVVDYVGSLLMPLYKARKIDREGYKTIMKKTATKVMELTTDGEKAMSVFEFLDFKRKNKIRAFVDMLIDRHMATRPDTKSGSSEKN